MEIEAESGKNILRKFLSRRLAEMEYKGTRH
jgi:hypothetical protein